MNFKKNREFSCQTFPLSFPPCFIFEDDASRRHCGMEVSVEAGDEVHVCDAKIVVMAVKFDVVGRGNNAMNIQLQMYFLV